MPVYEDTIFEARCAEVESEPDRIRACELAVLKTGLAWAFPDKYINPWAAREREGAHRAALANLKAAKGE